MVKVAISDSSRIQQAIDIVLEREWMRFYEHSPLDSAQDGDALLRAADAFRSGGKAVLALLRPAAVVEMADSQPWNTVEDEILVTGGLRSVPRLQTVEYDPNDAAAVPLTTKRIAATYDCGGPLPFLEGVYSVGSDPTAAIRALGGRMGWGEITDLEPQSKVRADLEEWYYRFYADGTSMKAAGRYVPGGVILTWWK